MFVSLGWKSLQRTNTLAYYKYVNYGQKGFITLGPGGRTFNSFPKFEGSDPATAGTRGLYHKSNYGCNSFQGL